MERGNERNKVFQKTSFLWFILGLKLRRVVTDSGFFLLCCHKFLPHPLFIMQAAGFSLRAVFHYDLNTVNSPNEQSRFEEFYRQEVQAVYRYVYARTRHHEEAREIVQESFLTYYQLQQAGETTDHERALLFRLARNRAIDALRRQRTRESFGQDATSGKVLFFRPVEPLTPEEILLEKERHHYAAAALEQLSERDQECLALRRSGLSYREIAEVLHINPNSVGQLVSRALRRFTESYEAGLGKKQNDEKAGKTG